MLFDWAADPYFTLICTFIFPPYFVTQLVADPIYGQVVWGRTTAAAALATGLIAPWAGSLADRSARIKPLFLAFCGLATLGAMGLWWSVPGEAYAVPLAVTCIVLATVGFEVATSLNNSMVRFIAPDREGSQLAWRGRALGATSGVVVLCIFVGFLTPGRGGLTILGLPPLGSLIESAGAVERLSGPFAAIWLVLFLLPLAILFKDARVRAPRSVIAGNLGPEKSRARHRPSLRFLIANMLLADGLLALFAFGGIYGATVFGWDASRLGLFAIALTVSGVGGLALCVPLDRRIGSRRIAAWSSAIAIGSVGLVLGLDPTHIFVWPARQIHIWLFANTAEIPFTLAGLVAAAASTSLQAALRSIYLLAVPPEKPGIWFGYFALSGKTTAFVGPMLVSAIIATTGSTKAGMAVVLGLLVVGALLLRSSGTERRSSDAQELNA